MEESAFIRAGIAGDGVTEKVVPEVSPERRDRIQKVHLERRKNDIIE